MIVLVLLSLAGCTAREGARVPTGATIVPTENALVLPPPGGPEILNVVERRFGNAVEQDVNLHTSASTPGQNYLRATFFGPTDAGLDQKTAAYSAVRASEMMREARRAIPGVPLVQSPYFLQNSYGPFGYAFGRRGGDACLYAWQQIRPPESQRSPLRSYGTIQVRLRFCATGATENELLSVVYGYTISGTIIGDPSWNPYGPPPPVDVGLGRTGSPIYRTEPPSDQAPALERPRRAVVTVPARAAAAIEKPEVTRQPVVAPLPAPQAGGSLPSPTGPAGAAGTVVVPLPPCAPQGGTACP
nr:cellulose biosynthesis protein BcsN [Ensifer sp. BR816]